MTGDLLFLEIEDTRDSQRPQEKEQHLLLLWIVLSLGTSGYSLNETHGVDPHPLGNYAFLLLGISGKDSSQKMY